MEPATQHFRGRTAPVLVALKANAEKWHETHNGASQTAVFRDVMPTAVGGGVKGDFTPTFNSLGFDAIFTSDKLALKMMGPVYNSNFLYRDTRGAVKMPVFGNDKYIVQHPLGDPGVDLGSGTKSKVSHLMVVSCADSGPVTFNEMLPSGKAEVDDLESRLNFLNSAFDGLKENIPISGCGKAVTDRATEMDVPLTTGMREFLALQISGLPTLLGKDWEAIITGRPGYRLLNSADKEIADTGCATILAEINELFDDDSLDLVPCIQDNENCSQLITHIHGFRIGKDVPQGLKDTYTDCRTILKVKKALLPDDVCELQRAGGALGRTASVAGGDDSPPLARQETYAVSIPTVSEEGDAPDMGDKTCHICGEIEHPSRDNWYHDADFSSEAFASLAMARCSDNWYHDADKNVIPFSALSVSDQRKELDAEEGLIHSIIRRPDELIRRLGRQIADLDTSELRPAMSIAAGSRRARRARTAARSAAGR